TSVTLEEASANLGASPFRTLRRITLPLVMANLLAGTILTFAFAMLEVSDGLILAMKEGYYPITKMIYQLMGRLDPGGRELRKGSAARPASCLLAECWETVSDICSGLELGTPDGSGGLGPPD